MVSLIWNMVNLDMRKLLCTQNYDNLLANDNFFVLFLTFYEFMVFTFLDFTSNLMVNDYRVLIRVCLIN